MWQQRECVTSWQPVMMCPALGRWGRRQRCLVANSVPSAALLTVFSCSHLLLDKLQRLQAHSQSLYSIAANQELVNIFCWQAPFAQEILLSVCAHVYACLCAHVRAHVPISVLGKGGGSEINIQFSSIASPPCFLTQGLSQSLEFTDSASPASQPAPQILPGPLE